MGHSGVSEWRTGGTRIGVWGKKSPETFDIRIRYPANPEILIEVTGSGKVNSHMCVRVSVYRVSGVGKTIFLVSRVPKSR
jgi:hypothetical protein